MVHQVSYKTILSQSRRVYFSLCNLCRCAYAESAYLAELGQPLQWLDGIATVETVLAAGLCIVVLVRLLVFVRDQTLPKARSMSSLR